MTRHQSVVAVAAVILISACARVPTDSSLLGSAQAPLLAKPPSDPTATWAFPLADAGLSVRSDHLYSDGTYSLYAHGVCSVSSPIFFGGTGDNTISFNYPRGSGKNACGRTWTVEYPDGYVEALSYSGGLQVLQNESFTIPVGNTTLRHFRFGVSSANSANPVAARCAQGLVFGPGGGNPAIGSDSVQVTRLDASTWRVRSQAAPNDHAYCIDNGQLYEMQIDFLIIASRPLP